MFQFLTLFLTYLFIPRFKIYLIKYFFTTKTYYINYTNYTQFIIEFIGKQLNAVEKSNNKFHFSYKITASSKRNPANDK